MEVWSGMSRGIMSLTAYREVYKRREVHKKTANSCPCVYFPISQVLNVSLDFLLFNWGDFVVLKLPESSESGSVFMG